MLEDREEEQKRANIKNQDLFCMGLNKKQARGPNPMSMKRKVAPKVIEKKKVKVKKRRVRKGKRSVALSAIKKHFKKTQESDNETSLI